MKVGKKILIGFCVLMGIGLVAAAIQSNSAPKDIQTASTDNQSPSIKAIVDTVGCSEEQSQNIQSILYDCGFSDKEIATITPFSTLDESGSVYELDGNLARPLMLVLNADNVVEEINIKMSDFQLYSGYERLWTLNDFRMTFEEKQQYRKQVRDMVSAILKSPSTAKYPDIDLWAIARQEGKVIVQGFVDSQNGFGATVRSEFQAVFDSGDEVESFVVDGEQVI